MIHWHVFCRVITKIRYIHTFYQKKLPQLFPASTSAVILEYRIKYYYQNLNFFQKQTQWQYFGTSAYCEDDPGGWKGCTDSLHWKKESKMNKCYVNDWKVLWYTSLRIPNYN